MNAPNVTFNVARRFQELRRRYATVRFGIVVFSAIAAIAAIWMLLAIGDYYWEWSVSWRKTGLLVGAGLVLAAILQRVLVIVRDTRQRRFAAQVEHEFDEFGQRIRTVLDTVEGRVSGPDEMIAALGHQTQGRWETVSPSQMIPARLLTAVGALCGLVMLIGAGLFAAGGDYRTSMLRALDWRSATPSWP